MADEKVVRKQKKVRAVRGSRAVASVAALVARLARAREKVANLEGQVEELKRALGGAPTKVVRLPPVNVDQLLHEHAGQGSSAAALSPDDAQGEGRWV